MEGIIVFQSNDDSSGTIGLRIPGKYISRCYIPANLLNSQTYAISVSADIPFVETIFHQDSVLSFEVEQTEWISGRMGEKFPGIFCPRLRWEISCLTNEKITSPLISLYLCSLFWWRFFLRRGDARLPKLGESKDILLIRLDEIGDFVLTSALLRELRRSAPSARITLIVKYAVLPLADNCPM